MMKLTSQAIRNICRCVITVSLLSGGHFALAQDAMPKVPRFSVDYMDRSINPDDDFYHYACGTWLKNNPVPADKSSWAGFEELRQRNWSMLHEILESAETNKSTAAHSPTREVGNFYASAMNTNRIEQLGIKPIKKDLARISALKNTKALIREVAALQLRDINVLFSSGASPDAKNSSVYGFELGQGGLSLPDRDYYLTDAFSKQRAAYLQHITRMLVLSGESEAEAKAHATTILDVETALAKASKSRTDLRDPISNYHKFAVSEMATMYPHLNLPVFFEASDVKHLTNVMIGQPEFFTALDQMVKERPLEDWKVYLRWHVLRRAAPFLSSQFENESFAFYGTVLSGQPMQEPRWQRSAKVIDRTIGEAMGELFVKIHYPPEAEARMKALIEDLRSVLHDRLMRVPWMSEATRAKALTKFDALAKKIGHPEKYRDYSKVKIVRDDYLGNVERAALFESKRELARVGKTVDRTEWHMTPQTVNAYFNPTQNEIVFPAGILQPPFFDVDMDDAVNYGAIGVVIGHEMTHSYDDQGRKYDAQGNLNDWWTESDAKQFEVRAQKLVDQYNGYEALPGLHVNGKLTLGENIADLGGTTIAYEALQRDLARDPSKRKNIDGLTPEQRFFISLAQIWRVNWREEALRQRITTDPHSPGQFRAIGPHVNLQEFYDAFGIKEGAPMWRSPDQRAIIW